MAWSSLFQIRPFIFPQNVVIYTRLSIKILCDVAHPISAAPVAGVPTSAVLTSPGVVAPLSFFCLDGHNCCRNDPGLGVAADTASRVAQLDFGMLECILAVVVAQKLSHSDSGHRSCFVETDAMLVRHTKLEVMQCVTELVRMQVDDELAVFAELEHGTTVRAVASQLHSIAAA